MYFRAFVAAFLFDVVFLISCTTIGWSQDPNTTYGGFCPPGSVASGGGGYSCVCPDGSLAGIGGCAGRSQPPQQQGNNCPSGGICAYGTTCCGSVCCNQGSKCGAAGSCIPQEANDCGDGHWCNAGTQCWRAPVNIGSVRQGELHCVTPSQAADLERAIANQHTAEREQIIANEAIRRNNDEQHRIGARRGEIERQQAEARRKLEQAAIAQKQAAQQFQKAAEQQRQASLQGLQKLSKAQPQSRAAAPATCAAKQIQAIANGSDPEKILCGRGSNTPTVQPVLPNAPSQRDKAWADQLEYLKRNEVRLQPEERKLAPATPQASIPPTPSSTGFQPDANSGSEPSPSALARIDSIGQKLATANASGLKAVGSDPDFRQAVSDLRDWWQAAKTTGVDVYKRTGNPKLALMAGYAAGEFSDLTKTYRELKSMKTAPEAIMDIMAQKLAEHIVSKTGSELAGAVGAPTPLWDTAKITSRFIMAYEDGFLDAAAPNGFRQR